MKRSRMLVSLRRINQGFWSHLVFMTKRRTNDRYKSTQHIATLLGATCCARLTTMLRHVAIRLVLLAQVWRWSNFSNNFQHVAERLKRVAKRAKRVAPSNVSICFADMLPSFNLAFYFQWSIESGGQAQLFPDERLVINKARGMPKLVLGFSDEDHRPFNEGVPPDIPIEILPLPNDCSVHNQIHQHERLLEVGSPCPTGLVHPGSE